MFNFHKYLGALISTFWSDSIFRTCILLEMESLSLRISCRCFVPKMFLRVVCASSLIGWRLIIWPPYWVKVRDWYCPLIRFKLTLLSGERSQRLPPRLWHWTPGSRQLRPPILSRNLSWEPAVVFGLKRRASRIGFSMQALITSWGGTSNVIVRRSTFW